MVSAAFGDVEVAGVADGVDDCVADGGEVGWSVAGAVGGVSSVKVTASVEENSKTTFWRRAPTSKLVDCAYPMPERNTVAKQAPANLR